MRGSYADPDHVMAAEIDRLADMCEMLLHHIDDLEGRLRRLEPPPVASAWAQQL